MNRTTLFGVANIICRKGKAPPQNNRWVWRRKLVLPGTTIELKRKMDSTNGITYFIKTKNWSVDIVQSGTGGEVSMQNIRGSTDQIEEVFMQVLLTYS